MTATTLITGTVAGFVLVIDPENEKGKMERLEFTDAADLQAKKTALDRQEAAYYKAHPRESYDPTVLHFFTMYKRDDDGTVAEQFGYSIPMRGRPSRKVGDAAYLSKCKHCGKTNWSEFPHDEMSRSYVTGQHVCADCNKPDKDDFNDFTNYDGMQEREY